MNDTYFRAKKILDDIIAQPEKKRTAYIDQVCSGDQALRDEVYSLLQAHRALEDSPSSFRLPHLGDTPTPVVASEASSMTEDVMMCPSCGISFEGAPKFCPHDRAPLVRMHDPLIGSLLDGLYQIDRKLGEGGMGAVYLGRQTLTDRLVAIKVLPRDYGSHPGRIRRFLKEGRAACMLDHPNVVTVYDLRSTSDGTLYMVLEYVQGMSLARVLADQKPLSLEETTAILEPVASALDAAHAAGIVHRDIKPDNIMVGADRQGKRIVKVLDLGIAKLLDEESSLTMGTPIGTPAFMAPEQWGAGVGKTDRVVDGRADVYSLGVMAFEMLTGRRPFLGPSIEAFCRQHCFEEIPPAHTLESAVSEACSAILMQAMAKERDQRTPSAGVFVENLRRLLGTGTLGTPRRPGVDTSSAANSRTMLDPLVPGNYAGYAHDPTVDISSTAPTGSSTVAPGPKTTGAILRVLALVAIAVAVVALFAVWQPWRVRESGVAPSVPAADVQPPPAAVREILQVSFRRLLDEQSQTWSEPLSGVEPIPVRSKIRFTFVSSEPGFLYIVSTGRGVKPMAFLTNLPPAGANLVTNEVRSGAPFEFPGAGTGVALLDEELRTSMWIVFSPVKLTSPACLNRRGGQPLLVADQAEFEQFLTSVVPTTLSQTSSESILSVPTAPLNGKPVAAELVFTARAGQIVEGK